MPPKSASSPEGSRLKREAHKLGIRARYENRRVHRAAARTSPFGLFASFLKIGVTGFGGGLAVIAQVRDLTVKKRRWLSEREFAEGFALAQSLPGTNAGNAVTYVGLLLHGWRGALAAMTGFILPSFVMMIGLSLAYSRFRELPDTDRMFHGLNAAVVALVLATAIRIGRRSLRRRWHWWVAGLALVMSVSGAATLEIVVGAGLVGIFVEAFADRRRQQLRRINGIGQRYRMRRAELEQRSIEGHYRRAVANDSDLTLAPRGLDPRVPRAPGSDTGRLGVVAITGAWLPLLAKVSVLVTIATIFLRVGAVTFGGGFVMIPMIEHSVVDELHWLSHQEFADATALGQITPGPVLITATFIGYKVAGLLGALVATVCVFAPAFAMTVVAGSSLRKFQANPQVQAFLRGVTPAVVGLLVAAAVGIGRAGIHSWVGLSIAAVALFLLLRFSVNGVAVIFGAGLARFLVSLILGS